MLSKLHVAYLLCILFVYNLFTYLLHSVLASQRFSLVGVVKVSFLVVDHIVRVDDDVSGQQEDKHERKHHPGVYVNLGELVRRFCRSSDFLLCREDPQVTPEVDRDQQCAAKGDPESKGLCSNYSGGVIKKCYGIKVLWRQGYLVLRCSAVKLFCIVTSRRCQPKSLVGEVDRIIFTKNHVVIGDVLTELTISLVV